MLVCTRGADAMPFGNNKKLSAPRPKKQKVQAREEESDDAEEDDFDEEIASNEAENTDPGKPLAASHAQPAPSPHRLKVQAAEDELLELEAEFEVRQEISEQVEAQLTTAQRLYDAKMVRARGSLVAST